MTGGAHGADRPAGAGRGAGDAQRGGKRCDTMGRVQPTRFLLIRHAESEWNAAGRWQGQGDPPLSARGRQQARELSEGLADERVDALIASDLSRALETARTLGRRWGLDARPDPRFRELDVGDWTGLTRAQIAERAGDVLERFEGEEPGVRPGGGETRDEIRERVRAATDAVARTHPGQRVAVVTHLGVIRALTGGREPGNAQCERLEWEPRENGQGGAITRARRPPGCSP